jgi:dihydroflavonol-4-reductase
VLHVASPFPNAAPAHEDELIIPARDGALRVLRAARDAGVRRVVLTSSFAPTAIFGPVVGADYSTSVDLIKRLLDGAMPGVPQLRYGVVDVRDLADLHVRAMVDPAAQGERFIGVAGEFMSVHDMALTLKQRMGADAGRVPTRILPNWLVRIAALRVAALKPLVPELGKRRNASNEKAKRLLGWAPRPAVDAIVATGESLVGLGLVKQA